LDLLYLVAKCTHAIGPNINSCHVTYIKQSYSLTGQYFHGREYYPEWHCP